MDIIAIIILGFVQALTEWLPLSSKTMDTIVYTQFFNGDKATILPLLLYLHIGTMVAAAIYFRKEIFQLTVRFFTACADVLRHTGSNRFLATASMRATRESEGKIGFLVAALAFTGIVGLPILLLENFVLPSLDAGALFSVMGIGLIITGFMLTAQHKNRWRSHETAGWKDGVLTGALQGLSAIPGISRAGSTTTALVWRGFDVESAFHLSFLLSIPTVFCMEVVLWLAQGGVSALPISDGLMLAASSFVFGYLTIEVLIKIAHKINVASLAFVFGIMMLAFGLFGLG
ncbi:MAG: undecaprenyl-diphosphate phosphatase [Candidatus Micrarchaeia archaeon]